MITISLIFLNFCMNNGQGMVAGDPVVSKAGSLVRTRSNLNLSYPFFTTHRFGEISPFFWEENLDGDKRMHLNSSSKIDSYTLKSPLMQDIKMKKDLFYVPRQAILPLNWEKVYTNPNIGEDVPEDAGTGVRSFWTNIFNLLSNVDYLDSLEGYSSQEKIVGFLKWAVFFEMFYSDGNLLSNLGVHGSKFLRISTKDDGLFDHVSFDTIFDYFCSPAYWSTGDKYGFVVMKTVGSSTEYYAVTNDPTYRPVNYVISLREFLDLLRDDLVGWRANVVYPSTGLKASGDIFDSFSSYLVFSNYATASSDELDGDDLDIARLWA